MYAAVPTMCPSVVEWWSSRPSSSVDRPKSSTTTRPRRATSTFDGLMSRCSRPEVCRASRASASCCIAARSRTSWNGGSAVVSPFSASRAGPLAAGSAAGSTRKTSSVLDGQSPPSASPGLAAVVALAVDPRVDSSTGASPAPGRRLDGSVVAPVGAASPVRRVVSSVT